MDGQGFRKYLERRNLSAESIEHSAAVVQELEEFLRRHDPASTPETADAQAVNEFSETLIKSGRNTFETYLALLRYGAFAKNRRMYVATMEFLDGAEAFGNLYTRLADEVGVAKRDQYFEGVSVPPLGTSNEKKPALVQKVLGRLEAEDPTLAHKMLSCGLRDLQEEWFQEQKTEYEACANLDEYLARKSQRLIEVLEKHKAEGTWWFVQQIDDEVLDFVRRHPEISGGTRDGRVVYEVKIPYMTKEWLAERDPQLRRYFACHCPWVRESLRSGDTTVSPTFCQCSAAFHKKPWEVIFGQPLRAEVLESILQGDDRCRFAIYLPEGV